MFGPWGHLCAGIGGGILASEILGHESILAVEICPWRCAILEERRRNGWFPCSPDLEIVCADLWDWEAGPWRGRLAGLAAGFPCQDISCAGKGAGIQGARSSLFFAIMQAVDIIRPRFVFLENSPQIRTRGRKVVWRELERRGYLVVDGTLAAAHVGAGHRRNRWWCLAAGIDGQRELERARGFGDFGQWIGDGHPHASDSAKYRLENDACGEAEDTTDFAPGRSIEASADSDCEEWGIDKIISNADIQDSVAAATLYTGAHDWIPPHAAVCGVVDGPTHRMDRIAACGDAQVPLQAATAFILLAQKAQKRQKECRQLTSATTQGSARSWL